MEFWCIFNYLCSSNTALAVHFHFRASAIVGRYNRFTWGFNPHTLHFLGTRLHLNYIAMILKDKRLPPLMALVARFNPHFLTTSQRIFRTGRRHGYYQTRLIVKPLRLWFFFHRLLSEEKKTRKNKFRCHDSKQCSVSVG